MTEINAWAPLTSKKDPSPSLRAYQFHRIRQNLVGNMHYYKLKILKNNIKENQ